MNQRIIMSIGIGGVGIILALGSLFFVNIRYQYESEASSLETSESLQEQENEYPQELSVRENIHIETPDEVRAVYMSSWVVSRPDLRSKIVDLVDVTALNAIVIDVKDSQGTIAYPSTHPEVIAFGKSINRMRDIKDFIAELHEKDIYVIARIAVFQDNVSARTHPSLAVQTPSGTVWQDRKGLAWFDVGSRAVWDYIVAVGEEAYALGFDEINLDYVRFPSDGNVQEAVFPSSGNRPHTEVLTEFFKYMNEEFRFVRGIPISADVFGLTTTSTNDLGIGQIFENIAPYVDAINPMIYPSHYPPHFEGYTNPASVPYEIITLASEGALAKLETLGIDKKRYRPWIQDFNMGATYTPELVNKQIQALYDLGVESFLVWDPANTYTQEAYTMPPLSLEESEIHDIVSL